MIEVPFMGRDEIRDRVHELCNAAFGDSLPCPVDLEALLFDHLYEKHGLAFYNHQPLDDDDGRRVLGITLPLKNEIHVCRQLRDSGHLGRYRFTVAHEIGHWVLHRPLFLEPDHADLPLEPRLITFKRDVLERSDGRYAPEEWQANYFAISLLLPDAQLRPAFEQRFGASSLGSPEARPPDAVLAAAARITHGPVAPLRRLSRGVAAARIGDAPSLAELFLLSIEACAIALEERGYVREDRSSVAIATPERAE